MGIQSGISFLYNFDFGNPHIDDPMENIVSFSSVAQGDFAPSNVTTSSTRHRWRSADVLTKQEIVLKAEVKSRVDTIAILGHNFSPEAVITLQANISDNWIAPPINLRLPYSKHNIIYTNELSGSYQYYKLSILDPSNPCGYVELGRFLGGRAFTMQNNEDITDSYSVSKKDMSESMKSYGYFRVSNESVIIRTLNVNFQQLKTQFGENDNYSGLQDLFDTVRTTRPFLTVLDRSNPSILNIWGQLKDMPNESYGINKFVNFSAAIEEVF